MCWIYFQNIHTFAYKETLLHTFLLLAFKTVESLQRIIKFACVDKVGVFSRESRRFSEVSRILLGGEFCMYGIISMFHMSIVSSFKKKESLHRLIIFFSLLDYSSWFILSLWESLVICWKSMVCWFFIF